MKTITVFLGLLWFVSTASGQKQMKIPTNAMEQFEKFKAKEKFAEDLKIIYLGIADEKLKPVLTEKINLVAEDFEKIAQNRNATDEDYQNAIKKGLDRFTSIYLEIDTEDRERICAYFEDLMDIVGLESSGGHLNNFMYGLLPTGN